MVVCVRNVWGDVFQRAAAVSERQLNEVPPLLVVGEAL